ncbi:hypothetical protein COCNU_scaffold030856G000030 [Cocos nucifera]|nr:hypothetical protein [Cocos nucifera]
MATLHELPGIEAVSVGTIPSSPLPNPHTFPKEQQQREGSKKKINYGLLLLLLLFSRGAIPSRSPPLFFGRGRSKENSCPAKNGGGFSVLPTGEKIAPFFVSCCVVLRANEHSPCFP